MGYEWWVVEDPPPPSPKDAGEPTDEAPLQIVEHARELGFDLVGVAPLAPPPDADRFERWLAEGRHGSMGYLAKGRLATTRPDLAWPGGKSLLMLGMGHSRPPIELPGGGRIARYAAGRDYHNVIQKRLRKLRKRLEAEGLAKPGPGFVDATPLLERSHAGAAGLGFASKAANLLHPRFGPWFFIAELILDVDLPPTASAVPGGSCGSCTACIDACPTQAIVAPGEVDARRCISYATIEHKGLVSHELREKTGGWAFGCDVCSEVCPWGSKAPNLAERFGLRPEFGPDADSARPGETLSQMVENSDLNGADGAAQHKERYEGSPLRRPGAPGLARNAAIALGGTPTDRGLDALKGAVRTAYQPMVRAAAAWGLIHGHNQDTGARPAVERALACEPDPEAAQDMRESLRRS